MAAQQQPQNSAATRLTPEKHAQLRTQVRQLRIAAGTLDDIIEDLQREGTACDECPSPTCQIDRVVGFLLALAAEYAQAAADARSWQADQNAYIWAATGQIRLAGPHL